MVEPIKKFPLEKAVDIDGVEDLDDLKDRVNKIIQQSRTGEISIGMTRNMLL